MTVYIETSAAGKLLFDEAESVALGAYLDQQRDDGVNVVSGALLETELRRIAIRDGLSQAAVTDILDLFYLYTPDRAVYAQAGLLPSTHLGSLDALHIAVAMRLEADAMVTYDLRQAEAAHAAGLQVVAPS
ncbi:type II toxin-antitoxin system VapC family toxin [Pseudonocardia spinosispora]|uniref:type II toxin-antitoxin system VapC family toxin n=1 Tax=Pseudonocardia spinosispora TaxID=103441 RepID=UPI000403E6F8|nr:type II toxin-antitoxin system VapC family toxin [Pseudonocardia spinosispora]